MTPLLLALTLAAPVPKDFKPAKTDGEMIVGRWEYVENSVDGNPPAANDSVRFQFEAGGRCVLLFKTGERKEVRCPLDPTGKPKSYQWQAPWGTFLGVYELNGDELRMALANGQNLPAPATVAPGAKVVYSVLKRVKE